ncbi:hypothetical protein KGQ55_01045 [Patescibacteria group bacterium]|nr:hypothetical protein [Patescibacteria group bacterium]
MIVGIIGQGAFGKAIRAELSRGGVEPVCVDAGETLAGKGPFDVVFLAVPAAALPEALADNQSAFRDALVVNTAKGMDERGRMPQAVVMEALSGITFRYAAVFGPSLADDLLAGRPVGLTIAAKDAGDRALLSTLLAKGNLLLDATDDVRGVELAGVMKNVYALLFGYADAIELGRSARAALFSAAVREFESFAKAEGASPDIVSFGALGDFALSALSNASRNHAFGMELAALAPADIEKRAAAKTVEGYRTVRILADQGLITDAFPLLSAAHAIAARGADAQPLVRGLFAS